MKFYWFLLIFSIWTNKIICQEIRGATPVFQTDLNQINQTTYAIIIGVSDYPHLKSLQYAHKDAILFKHFLMSDAGGNVPENNIKIQINEQATTSNFWVGALGWLNDKNLQSGDRVFIFLAGHGDAINEDEFFFLTYDCAPGKDKANYISTGNIQMYNLKSRIKRLTSKGIEVILIVDACRTGDLPGGDDGLKYFTGSIIEQKAGELMLLSAGPNQYSFEDKSFGGGHGLFTYYLIHGLSGTADENEDGNITFVELEDYVKKQVRTVSSKKLKQPQIPTFCCSNHFAKVMSTADQQLNEYVINLDKVGSIYDGHLLAANTKTPSEIYSDTLGHYLYVSLRDKIRREQFKGENNARAILNQMINQCPDCELTRDAKRDLAVAYLNYGQAKINLYVSGLDSRASIRAYRESMISNTGRNEESKFQIEQKISGLERLQSVSFEDAENWMKDAMALLDYDRDIYALYESRISFLELYNLTFKTNINNQNKEHLIARLNQALEKDSSAYMMNLAGLIYNELGKYEQALLFYFKTMKLAPVWSYPVNNIGCIYFDIKKDYAEAEKWYLKAIQIDSNNVNATSNLGIVYENLKRFEEAEKWYLKAIIVDSNYVYPYNNLGDLYRNQMLYEGAEQWYLKAIEIDSNFVYAYNNLGNLYRNQKFYEEAEQWYLKAIEIDSNFVYAYNRLGNLLDKLKRYEEAEKWYLKAIIVDSNYVYPYNNLGNLYRNQKLYEEAEQWYLKAIEIDSNFVYPYNDLGVLYENQKLYKEAEQWYLKAIEIDSNFVYPYNNLGDLRDELKRYEEAEKWYLKAIIVDSNYVYPYNNLGNLYRNQKLYEEAEQWYLKAIEIDSNFVYPYNNLGDMYFNKKLYKEAEKWYQKSITIDINYLHSYINLGIIYRDQERFSAAESMFKKVYEKDNNSIKACLNLSFLYKNLKMFNDAEKYINKLISIDSNYYYGYEMFGNIFFDQNKFVDAISKYEKSYELDSMQFSSYSALGRCNLEIGNIENAISWFRRGIFKKSDEVNCYLQLAILDYNNTKSFKDSREYIFRAMALDSFNLDVLHLLGHYYEEYGKIDSAKYFYNKCLKFNNSNLTYHLYVDLHRISRISNSYEERIYYISKMLDQNNNLNFHSLQNNLGYNYFLVGNLDSSYFSFRQAISKGNTFHHPYTNLGILFLMKSMPDSALHYLHISNKMIDDPDVLQSLLMYACYNAKGDTYHSSIWIEKGIEILNVEFDTEPEEGEKLFEWYLVKIFLEPDNADLYVSKLIDCFKKHNLDYSFIMDYKPLLMQPVIYNYTGLRDLMFELYPYWYE